jgi:hypothetical protein
MNMRLIVLGLALSLSAMACKDKAVGSNPGAIPQLISDPVTGTYANVAPTGELTTSNQNASQYNALAVLGTVKASAGTVSGVQVTSMDKSNVVFVQLSNNSAIQTAVDSGVGITPVLEYALPAAAPTASNYPGYPVQVIDNVTPKVYFDAGIGVCVSTSASACVTTSLDAGSYLVQVQYN